MSRTRRSGDIYGGYPPDRDNSRDCLREMHAEMIKVGNTFFDTQDKNNTEFLVSVAYTLTDGNSLGDEMRNIIIELIAAGVDTTNKPVFVRHVYSSGGTRQLHDLPNFPHYMGAGLCLRKKHKEEVVALLLDLKNDLPRDLARLIGTLMF